MVKNLLLLICILFISNNYSQTNWELLNPRPTENTGKAIEFVSSEQGYIITNKELLETTDAGNSWTTKMNVSSANDMSFFNNIGFIAGNGYLLKTIDSGNSWEQVPIVFNYAFNTVNIIDENNIILSSSANIIKTSDGGDTWQLFEVPHDRINKTFFVSTSTGHAVCEDGTILKTVDGGLNWYVTQSTNIVPSDYLTVYFVNENVGFASKEHSDIYKTTDGGETWLEIASSSMLIYDFHFLNENHGFATGRHGEMMKTTDGGNTWNRIPFQGAYISNTSMYGVHFENSEIGYATGARGRIIKTTNGGQTWTSQSLNYNDVNQIKFFENGVGYAQSGGDFYKTTDYGDNWFLAGKVDHYNYCKGFFFVNEEVGYSIGGGVIGDIFKTIDGGVTWNKLELVLEEGMRSIFFIDENTGFVSGGYNRKQVYKTTDGGITWDQVFDQVFGKIQFLNDQIGYANRVNNYYNRIYKTTDGGYTWEYVFEIDENIQSFHFVDKNNGYLIGDEGLMHKTIDGGLTWQELSIPYEYYWLVNFYNKDVGFIIDEDGKIYKTTDGGLTWEYLTTKYRMKDIELITGKIFIAGSSGKIYRSDTDYDFYESINADIFNVRATNETCADKNNGSLTIQAEEEHPFILEMNDNLYDFSSQLEIEDLSPGVYNACISIEDRDDFRQCFEFSIQPGGNMQGRMQSTRSPEGTRVNVNINEGTAPFTASLDGNIIGRYNSTSFSILADSEGMLEITSSKACEGKMAFQLETMNTVLAFPNPTSAFLNISIPASQRMVNIPVFIYNTSGQLIHSATYKRTENMISLDVEKYSPGIYYAVLRTETPYTIKFSKK